jgi:hypothetical protein
MSRRTSRFDLEWWIVPKRLIYVIVALALFSLTAGGAALYLYLYGNPFKDVAAGTAEAEGARFDSFEGDVRVTRAATRETLQARSDTRLYPGDVVQTQEDGRARITLADGSTLLIKPNSVITIAENTRNQTDGHTNVRVAVDRGFVNVRTERQDDGTSNVVKTPLTENSLAGQTTAIFGVRDDKQEEIRVPAGSVETSTRNGEKATLSGGEFALVNQSADIVQRERLLDAPAPAAPRNLEKISVRRGATTSVALRWQKPATGTPAHYRVEVANSPFFVDPGKVIERDQLQTSTFSVGDLGQGNYFWRVRAVAQSGQSSEWSEPQKFTVVPEGDGEQVAVSGVSVEHVGGNVYIIRGRTGPGMNLFCAGRQTLSGSDGGFQLQISAPPGAREVTLEAENSLGGRSSHKVALQQ